MQLGYHFCEIKNGRPTMRDGTPVEVGATYTYDGPLKLCSTGYHDSPRAIDALSYAPGTFLCRVEVSADVEGDDKRVSRVRRVLAGADVSRELVDFASKIAFCALLRERELGREPDPRSWAAIQAAQAWLRGEASIEDVRAAAHAAYATTYAAPAYAADHAAAAHAAYATTYAAPAYAADHADAAAAAYAAAARAAAYAYAAPAYAADHADAAAAAAANARAEAREFSEGLLLSCLPENLR